MDYSIARRQFILGASLGVGATVAGCTSGGETDTDHGEHGHEAETADSDTDDYDPDLRVNGTVLSDPVPLELVEPDVEPFEGYGTSSERIANLHWHGKGDSHWHQQPLEIPVEGSLRVRTRFIDRNSEELSLGSDSRYSQSVQKTVEATERVVSIAVDGAYATFTGEGTGTGQVVFQLRDSEDGTILWESPDLEMAVIE